MIQKISKILLLSFLIVGLSNCTTDDDATDTTIETDLLYDKWWGADFENPTSYYFASDRIFKRESYFGPTTTYTGVWEWHNEIDRIMFVHETSSDFGDVDREYYLHFETIEENDMSVAYSENSSITPGSTLIEFHHDPN